jgi:hypothetical protein
VTFLYEFTGFRRDAPRTILQALMRIGGRERLEFLGG